MGAVINLDNIPKPRGIDFEKWVICFQSYGFILSVDPKLTPSVLSLFQKVNVAASVVGQVKDTHRVVINNGSEQAMLFDFNKDRITGISKPN